MKNNNNNNSKNNSNNNNMKRFKYRNTYEKEDTKQNYILLQVLGAKIQTWYN